MTSIPQRSRSEIKARFGDLKSPANERPRAERRRARRPSGTRVSIETDREATGTSDLDREPRRRTAPRRQQARLPPPARRAALPRRSSTSGSRTLARKPDAPFIGAFGGISSESCATVDAFSRVRERQGRQGRGRAARAAHRGRAHREARHHADRARARAHEHDAQLRAERRRHRGDARQPRVHRRDHAQLLRGRADDRPRGRARPRR